ncbi:major facilitator superfamily domain-containing protein [Chaetomidium leptoderma]|uniref:Major facilitator superfamily domain-containing protein n=1 Tax=Chaetomidium leptoderma TaxID=669021 RepID=A0AAN6ZTM6_9PEZI|nr:major facilitator superfamily domain-containing protein [Chaetomidium leptoderma]
MDESSPADREPPLTPSLSQRILSELGLAALARAHRDVKLLILQRFVRLAAYGASTLVLVSFLRGLGHSRARAGLFMTLTLVGDVLISLLLSLSADRLLGRRAVLALGAALMAASGFVFAAAPPSYWALLAAAVLGVISPSGNEIGPFRAVEESVVAHLTLAADRADVYAWYSLAGTAGTALGMVTCGWAVEFARSTLDWALLDAYRAVFLGYAVMGLVKLVLALALSPAVEADEEEPPSVSSSSSGGGPTDTTPLLNGESEPQPETRTRRWWAALLPQLSPESKGITTALCLLFALDSFASGLAPLSWVTYYFRSRFGLDEGRLGSVFFTTSIISAASIIVASALAKRLGNVKTMVFTHLPSAVFLALIPAPSSLPLSLLFLILRACTQSMDVAPRSAFLAAVLLPSERTAVMGAINVVKTGAQSLGPLITGVLADKGLFWVSFVLAGSLKASYDLGLLAVFKNYKRDRGERRDEEQE